jgi:hypothetical protein
VAKIVNIGRLHGNEVEKVIISAIVGLTNSITESAFNKNNDLMKKAPPEANMNGSG